MKGLITNVGRKKSSYLFFKILGDGGKFEIAELCEEKSGRDFLCEKLFRQKLLCEIQKRRFL